MSEEILSLERFASLLDAYGARLERWPESEARAARALLEVSERAQEMLREEAKFEGQLDALEISPLSPELAGRLAQIPLGAQKTRAIWPFGSLWAPALGWAAAAAIGLWIGAHAAEDTDEQDTAGTRDEVELVQLTTGAFAELEDEP